MIQYIASDLDGTLLPEGAWEIDPEVFDLILKLKEKGVRFIAASGRQYYSSRILFEPIKDEISYISENGSLCIHNGEVISRSLIDRELGLRIIDATREYDGCHVLLSCESRHYTDSKSHEFLHYMRECIRADIEVVDDLHHIEEPFLKLSICDFNGTDRLAAFLRERFETEIRIVTAGDYWVDFLAPNTNKGTTLLTLLKHLGIDPKNGVTFGDQYNDIDMLQAAGTSYAMATAVSGVSDYATHVTDSVPKILKEILDTL